MEQQKFKFEPIWISALCILIVCCAYKVLSIAAGPGFKFSGMYLLLILPVVIVAAMFLPMGIKMILGVPAIELTADQLIDNVAGVAIDWQNIQNIWVKTTTAKSTQILLTIDLKNTDQFYAGIANPFKRVLLKLLGALSPGDMVVNMAFVSGDNNTIAAIIRIHWSRFYGYDD